MSAGTKTPRSTAAAASPLTQSDMMEWFDHSTTMVLAVSSSCSIDLIERLARLNVSIHQTDHPRALRALATVRAHYAVFTRVADEDVRHG